ncbi:UPF0158 family protein [Alteribacter populi]|uniref:UPF0158 family protein n=1 Tax=Alteribacter populi TaxID=2011011 RepID=UPI000BBAD0AD|nr:UPF0158 family protein [Alteribacter populi]
MKSIHLNEIIDELEMLMEEYKTYFNKKTYKITSISTTHLRKAEDVEEGELDTFPDWIKHELVEAIAILEDEEDGQYVELPSKFQVNEYEIMKEFSFSQDAPIQSHLLRTIDGRGAFRRFKDEIISLNIEQEWYSYRRQQLRKIAVNWCERNSIKYMDDK